VFLAAPGDEDFTRLGQMLGAQKLLDDIRFATAADREQHDIALAAELEAIFAQQPAAVWERRLARGGVGCVEVHDAPHAAYVFDAPWGKDLGFVDTAAAVGKGPYRRYGRGVRTEATLGPPGAADVAGAQTRSILAEVGYETDAIEDLLRRGVVLAAEPAAIN
jgi:crotonobetainyl-CoA:carnitine CoA-transferase CaiB-like acyl-CoA transferase